MLLCFFLRAEESKKQRFFFFAPKKVREKRFFFFAPKKVREYSFPFPSRGERDDKEILLPAGKTLQKPSSVRRTSKILCKKRGEVDSNFSP